MQRTLVVARTEFRVFHAARLLSFVFRRRVIPHFADGTLECYDVSHDKYAPTLLRAFPSPLVAAPAALR